MEWKYVEPLKNPQTVKDFLEKQCVALPDEVVSFIVQHNAGRPKVNRFDTDKSKECIFDGVFSYNVEDPENIYNVYTGNLQKTMQEKSLFPLGLNPSGDLICIDIGDNNRIKLYRMENDEIELIVNNIAELENKLY